MLNIEQALQKAVLLLNESPSARIDAQVLLCHVLDKPSSYLFTWPEKVLSVDENSAFQALIERRQKGEPVAYIIGYRDFWSLKLKVSTSTLIPRPDTELLVELALDKLDDNKPHQVLDLGTGTGAIALAIASEKNNAKVLGVDFRNEAVSLAKENKQNLAIENANFMQSNWFSALQGRKFDLIVSNPPYIDANDIHLFQGDVRFEPSTALVADNKGLADIEHICHNSVKYLEISGWLLIEHGFDQGAAVREIFQQAKFEKITTIPDYNGLERVTLGCFLQN